MKQKLKVAFKSVLTKQQLNFQGWLFCNEAEKEIDPCPHGGVRGRRVRAALRERTAVNDCCCAHWRFQR